MGVAETYADYMPSKGSSLDSQSKQTKFLFSVKLGKKHPDPVVETASLSSVEPADAWYKLSLPEDLIMRGSLSALQLEAIIYACQQHDHILPDGKFQT